MTNLLGDLWGDSQPDWQQVFKSASTKLHLYGKASARVGRKMGHYCTLADSVEAAQAEADTIFTALSKQA
jgi:5-(carboxyamino)imidazole ribonucleotide synthase